MRISDWSSDVCSSDLILADDPGLPSVCRKFNPGIFPTNAPAVVEDNDRMMSSAPMDEIATVNVSFFCAIPKPVTTTSSNESKEEIRSKATLIDLSPTPNTARKSGVEGKGGKGRGDTG